MTGHDKYTMTNGPRGEDHRHGTHTKGEGHLFSVRGYYTLILSMYGRCELG